MSGLSEVNVNVQTDEAFLRISIHHIISYIERQYPFLVAWVISEYTN